MFHQDLFNTDNEISNQAWLYSLHEISFQSLSDDQVENETQPRISFFKTISTPVLFYNLICDLYNIFLPI